MELNDTQYLNVRQLVEVFIRLDISKGKKIKYEDLNGYIDLKSATIIQYTIKGRFMSR